MDDFRVECKMAISPLIMVTKEVIIPSGVQLKRIVVGPAKTLNPFTYNMTISVEGQIAYNGVLPMDGMRIEIEEDMSDETRHIHFVITPQDSYKIDSLFVDDTPPLTIGVIGQYDLFPVELRNTEEFDSGWASSWA